MNEFIQKLKYNYQNGEINVKIIFLTVGIFILSIILNLIFQKNFGFSIENFFEAKASLAGFFSQPWGIITYTFFHGNIMHLLLNMLMIYFVGQMFLRYFRKEDFLTFFLFGSISGAIVFMIFSEILNYHNSLIGASAAVYAIFFALVAYIPKTKVQLMFLNFNIPLDYIGYFLLGFDVLMILSGDNVGGHISHLGGAAFGFLYMKQFEKGKDFLGKTIRSIFFRQKKMKVHKTQKPPRDDYEFNSQKVDKQRKVDDILDKISRSGYESLTKEEKDFLFKSGR